MARMQETTKQLEQQRKIKVSVILFSLTRLAMGCETTRCMHQYYFGLTTISFPKQPMPTNGRPPL